MIRFLSIIFLLFFFSLPSCIIGGEEEEKSRKVSRREAKQARKREGRGGQKAQNGKDKPVVSPPQEEGEKEEETLIFPVLPERIDSEQVTLYLDQIGEDYKKVSISAKPDGEQLRLIAGLSGHLSLDTVDKDIYTFTIKSLHKKNLYFELHEKYSIFAVAAGTEVAQKEVLAVTVKPIVFYVKENGDLSVLCLSVDSISPEVKVINNFPRHPACN